MNASAKKQDLAVECRFLDSEQSLNEVFAAAVASDMRNAQLTAAFRLYYRLRSFVPLPLRQLLQRMRPVEAEADWYMPRVFLDALSRSLSDFGEAVTTIHPWPDGAKLAFVLTHDVETAEGMRRIEKIAELEEQLGFRSSWNIVPYKYRIGRGLVCDLRRRGFEIGIHGYNHDGKLFTSRRIFDSRVPAINAALESYGAVGFRAPMVHRNLEWLQSLNVAYDASCFDRDPYQAMPGGAGSIWPFIAGRFVELPYTMPQDHTLFVALNERDGRIWEQKLQLVEQLSGMSLIITHPDYLDSGYRLDAYRRLLERVREMIGVWHALPQEVAAWWRDRDESAVHRSQMNSWTIEGPAAERGRVATLRSVHGEQRSDGNNRNACAAFAASGTIEWAELQLPSTSLEQGAAFASRAL